MAVWALDAPSVARRYKRHLVSVSPPCVNLARKGKPQPVTIAKFGQMAKQIDVHVALATANHVIRMRDDADQPVVLADQANLLFPQRDRVVVQDVKQRVVLNG